MISAADFHETVNPLAIATNRVLDDETWEVYHDKLKEVPLETLQKAVGRLTSSQKFFPSVGEIREACDLVRAGTGIPGYVVPAPLADDDPRVWYACVTCQDSGWAPHWCVGSVHVEPKQPDQFQSIGTCGSHACARFGAKGYGHEFVKRCVCYATNPRIRERLEARRKYADT